MGAHYRSDFPQAKRPGWQQHSRLSLGEGISGTPPRKSRGLLLALKGCRLTGRSVMAAVANEEGPVIAQDFADVLSRFVDRRQGLITINDVLARIVGRQARGKFP